MTSFHFLSNVEAICAPVLFKKPTSSQINLIKNAKKQFLILTKLKNTSSARLWTFRVRSHKKLDWMCRVNIVQCQVKNVVIPTITWTNIFNPSVPKAHNSECLNLPIPLHIKPVMVSSSYLPDFYFLHPRHLMG